MKHTPPQTSRPLIATASTPSHTRSHIMLAAAATALMLSPPGIRAADLAKWDLSALSGISPNAPVTSTDPAVLTAGSIIRGSGLTATSFGDGLSSSGWTLTNSPNDNDYYEFSITPAPGSFLDINTLHFAESRSSTGITAFVVRSSLDNFTGTIDSAVQVLDNENSRDHSISLGAAFDSISGQITFRIYGYAAESSGGTWRLRNHSTKSGLVLEGAAMPAAGSLSINILPASFPESSANPAASGTLTRSGDLSNPLTVTLTTSDTTEATVPATVVIPASQNAVNFGVTAVDDLLPDGNISVTVSATAAGYTDGTTQITVQDDGDLVPLVINEVDCDTPGEDTAEFIELFNKSAEPYSLNGLVVVLFNGDNNLSYRTIDLSGHVIPAHGFFVIGNTGVPNMGLSLQNGELKNGADAVALYAASAASITNGTLVTGVSGTLVDALVYDTNEADDPELLAALTPGKPQMSEGTGASSEANSMSRLPNGGAAFDTTLYVTQAPTPGTSNVLPGNTFAAWISGYNVGTETGANGDFDNDGLDNAVENILGGNPSLSSSGLTGVSGAANTVTFRHTLSATPAADLTATYEWSSDMSAWHPAGSSDGGVTVTFSAPSVVATGPPDLVQVTATATGGTLGRLFARLKVSQP